MSFVEPMRAFSVGAASIDLTCPSAKAQLIRLLWREMGRRSPFWSLFQSPFPPGVPMFQSTLLPSATYTSGFIANGPQAPVPFAPLFVSYPEQPPSASW